MAQVELLLPKMGESVAEATIIKWLKKEEALMLQAWCIATFTSEEFRAIIREVFKKVVA